MSFGFGTGLTAGWRCAYPSWSTCRSVSERATRHHAPAAVSAPQPTPAPPCSRYGVQRQSALTHAPVLPPPSEPPRLPPFRARDAQQVVADSAASTFGQSGYSLSLSAGCLAYVHCGCSPARRRHYISPSIISSRCALANQLQRLSHFAGRRRFRGAEVRVRQQRHPVSIPKRRTVSARHHGDLRQLVRS